MNELISSSRKSDKTDKSHKTDNKCIALIGLTVSTAAAFGVSLLAIPFIIPAFRRVVLPYIPATDSQVKHILNCVSRRSPPNGPNGRLIDLGSGDGRVVIACAKLGINSFGVELNPWLVLYSKVRSRLLGVNSLAHFERTDLWKVNTAMYDKIVIFGVQDMMHLLEKKIAFDCDTSGNQVTVIACRFPLPNWPPIELFGTGIDTVWVYRYPL